MQYFYDSNGLIRFDRCMYCLEKVDERKRERTANHFVYWCKVMPKRMKLEAGEQWEYSKKLREAGKGESLIGVEPPSLLVDAEPGREGGKRRLKK